MYTLTNCKNKKSALLLACITWFVLTSSSVEADLILLENGRVMTESRTVPTAAELNLFVTLSRMGVKWVRIEAPAFMDSPITGKILSAENDTLTVQTESQTWRLPVQSILAFQISRGMKTNTMSGARIGFLAGAIAGVAIGATADVGDQDASMIVGGLLFGALGYGVGAIIGTVYRTRHWEKFPLDRFNVGFHSNREYRFQMSLSIAF